LPKLGRGYLSKVKEQTLMEALKSVTEEIFSSSTKHNFFRHRALLRKKSATR